MKLIQLTRGMYAKVDDEDHEIIMSMGPWFAKLHGHERTRTWAAMRNAKKPGGGQRPTMMHHDIMGAPPEKGLVVDHRDGDPLNNQRANLRWATLTQNCQNARPRPSDARGLGKSSRFKGVRLHPISKLWVARIQVERMPVHIGCFRTELQAVEAYDRAALRHHGEFARPNFPREPFWAKANAWFKEAA